MDSDKNLSAVDKLEMNFFDLMEEKHYSKIKVSELIKRAGVSRTTFYRHYDDIFDMYRKVSVKLISALVSESWPIAIEPEENTALKIFDDFMVTVENHQRKLKLLCGTNGDSQYIFSLIMDMFFERIENCPIILSKEERFKMKFICDAGHRVVSPYIYNGERSDKETLLLFRKILKTSLKAFDKYYYVNCGEDEDEDEA